MESSYFFFKAQKTKYCLNAWLKNLFERRCTQNVKKTSNIPKGINLINNQFVRSINIEFAFFKFGLRLCRNSFWSKTLHITHSHCNVTRIYKVGYRAHSRRYSRSGSPLHGGTPCRSAHGSVCAVYWSASNKSSPLLSKLVQRAAPSRRASGNAPAVRGSFHGRSLFVSTQP